MDREWPGRKKKVYFKIGLLSQQHFCDLNSLNLSLIYNIKWIKLVFTNTEGVLSIHIQFTEWHKRLKAPATLEVRKHSKNSSPKIMVSNQDFQGRSDFGGPHVCNVIETWLSEDGWRPHFEQQPSSKCLREGTKKQAIQQIYLWKILASVCKYCLVAKYEFRL